jgi:hypothetical protein
MRVHVLVLICTFYAGTHIEQRNIRRDDKTDHDSRGSGGLLQSELDVVSPRLRAPAFRLFRFDTEDRDHDH